MAVIKSSFPVPAVFLLAFSAFFCLIVFSGCPETGIGWEGNDMTSRFYDSLSAETRREIKQAYLVTYLKPGVPKAKVKGITIHQHADINGCNVVSITDIYSGEPGNIRAPVFVAGVPFDPWKAFVWKDGYLYGLYAAQDLGFVPKGETFEGLSEETQTQIKQTYFDVYFPMDDLPYWATPDRVTIANIKIAQHTVVNGCGVVLILEQLGDRGFKYLTPPIVIGGVRFYVDSIFVWKENCLYTLQDAYDLGVLPEEK